jgi:hypothetical protein
MTGLLDPPDKTIDTLAMVIFNLEPDRPKVFATWSEYRTHYPGANAYINAARMALDVLAGKYA